MDSIKVIIDAAGGVSAVARAFGITRGAVYDWIRNNEVPAERVLSLSKMTGWLVTPHMLRRDLYPNPIDALPQEAKDGHGPA